VHHIYTDEEMLKRLKEGSTRSALLALRHFKELIARREAELILDARREQMAWLSIAGFLGRSPQAVHQRWKRLNADDRI